jgi:hypothetical protein
MRRVSDIAPKAVALDSGDAFLFGGELLSAHTNVWRSNSLPTLRSVLPKLPGSLAAQSAGRQCASSAPGLVTAQREIKVCGTASLAWRLCPIGSSGLADYRASPGDDVVAPHSWAQIGAAAARQWPALAGRACGLGRCRRDTATRSAFDPQCDANCQAPLSSRDQWASMSFTSRSGSGTYSSAFACGWPFFRAQSRNFNTSRFWSAGLSLRNSM